LCGRGGRDWYLDGLVLGGLFLGLRDLVALRGRRGCGLLGGMRVESELLRRRRLDVNEVSGVGGDWAGEYLPFGLWMMFEGRIPEMWVRKSVTRPLGVTKRSRSGYP